MLALQRPPNGEELYDHDNDPTEWMNLSAMAEHTDTKEHLGGVLPESPSRRKIPRLPDLPPSARPMLEIPAGRFAKSDAPNYVELKAAHK